MADDIVNRIRDALDIAEVIGDSVRLVKRGPRYIGLCPFHDEKTPSFTVTPERGSWYCFGCGKGGDIFSFVMEKEGLNFREALEYLGRRAGIEVPQLRGQGRTTDLYSVMEMAVAFYRSELKGTAGAAGRGYLARRGMTMRDADAFELGWAPASWRSLVDALTREGASADQLLKCGLVLQSDRGRDYYDRFRGRLIFPIRNVSGRVIALGGRIVDGEGAKYLNSPEGVLYNKRNNLYLLDRAKKTIREKGRSILVEGYMDAVRLHMHGHQETVASLGTSLTESQAALLKRFADRCFICYDGDTAGQNATLRGMYVLQGAGLQVYVVNAPGGKDPDEILQTEGGDAIFESALEAAKPLVMHHIGLFREAARRDGQAKAATDFLEVVAGLSAVELAPYMQEIGHAVGLPDYQLASELDRLRKGRRLSAQTEENLGGEVYPLDLEVEEGEARPPCDPAEAGLLSLLWRSVELRTRTSAQEVVKLLSDELLQNIAMGLMSGVSTSEMERQWLEIGDTFPMSAISGGVEFCATLPGSDAEKLALLCKTLERRSMRARYEKLRAMMFRGEATQENLAEYAQLAARLKNS